MEKRPAGITIISFIYLLVAALGLMANFSFTGEHWFSTVTMLILAVTSVAFFLRQQWAWWVIGTMTMFSIAVNIPQLLLVVEHTDKIPNVQKYYLKHGGKLVIQSLILFFLFSQPVIDFFAFKNIKKSKQFLILTAAAAGLFLIVYLL